MSSTSTSMKLTGWVRSSSTGFEYLRYLYPYNRIAPRHVLLIEGILATRSSKDKAVLASEIFERMDDLIHPSEYVDFVGSLPPRACLDGAYWTASLTKRSLKTLNRKS